MSDRWKTIKQNDMHRSCPFIGMANRGVASRYRTVNGEIDSLEGRISHAGTINLEITLTVPERPRNHPPQARGSSIPRRTWLPDRRGVS